MKNNSPSIFSLCPILIYFTSNKLTTIGNPVTKNRKNSMKCSLEKQLFMLLYLVCITSLSVIGQIPFNKYVVGDQPSGFLTDMRAADIDGDGDMDLCSAHNIRGAWWENIGNNAFTYHELTNKNANSIYPIDFDSDGDMDIVIAVNNSSFDPYSILWFENDGEENFVEHDLLEASSVRKMRVADFDNDEDWDIVGIIGKNLFLWTNDGTNQFTRVTLSFNLDTVNDLRIGDIDADNLLEVLITEPNEDDITLFLNNGNSFSNGSVDLNLDRVQSAVFNDINGDGKMDVLATGRDADEVVWYAAEDGFSYPNINTKDTIDYTFAGATAVGASDLDGDGDVDVVATSITQNIIAYFENDGTQNFTKHIIATGENSSNLIIEDFNNDNKPDLFVSAYDYENSQSIFVLFENDGQICSTKPTFTITNQSSCPEEEYNFDIVVSDFGASTEIELLINDAIVVSNVVLDQSYSYGPYPINEEVVITLRDKSFINCKVDTSIAFVGICNPASIVSLYNFSDPHPSSIDGFSPRFTNLLEGESLPNTYNYFGTNFSNNDIHLWEFDGCQFSEIYHKDYDLFSEKILDSKGNLIVYGTSKLEEASFVFKYDGQTLTRYDNPPNYNYSFQFHLAKSTIGNNYFIYFTGAGAGQTYKIFYIDNNEVLQEVPNPAGYHPTISLPAPLERGFADNSGNVFILYQKLDNQDDRIWGVHDGTSLSLLYLDNGDSFSMDFQAVASNGNVIFAEEPSDDPVIPNAYIYNENGLTIANDFLPDPFGGNNIYLPIDITSDVVGTDGTYDYFSSNTSDLIRYDGEIFDYIFPQGGSASKFVKIDDSGLLWGKAVSTDYQELYTYDGSTYTSIPNPTDYHFNNNAVESNGKHFFVYGYNGNVHPHTLSYSIAYVEDNELTFLNNEHAVINDIWLDETTNEVYVVQGNWGLYFNTDLPNAYYQSNQNDLYRFNNGTLDRIPLPNNYPWFEDVYLLNGKTFLVLKPAYDSDEMVLFTIENKVVTPLQEHFTINSIHTPSEAAYMLVSANDYMDMIKILPDSCDNAPCPMTLDVSGDPFRIGYFQATQEITMSNVSEALCKVVAGESITLAPGFLAKEGSEFLAEVGFKMTDYPACSPLEKKLPNNPLPSTPIVRDKVEERQKDLVVFPNPFSSTTTVQYTLDEPSSIQMELYDINGRLVKTILPKSYEEEGMYEIRIERNDLQFGMYYLHLVTEKEQLVRKVLLVK